MADLVQYSVEGSVGLMTLNRPERRNAVNTEMGLAINAALVRAALDKSIRALVITGAGPAFCAGGDMERLATLPDRGEAKETVISAADVDPFFNVLPDVPPELRSRYTFAQAMTIPVVAAVNGPAIGAGLALALSADIRFASTEAGFAGGFARIGGIPELGLIWTVAKLIGDGRARDMLLSGRRVGAEEALQFGLVTRVYEPSALLTETLAFARDMAENTSPRSIGVIKRLMRQVHRQSFGEAFEASRLEIAASQKSNDFREGVAAVREKRPPRFTGT